MIRASITIVFFIIGTAAPSAAQDVLRADETRNSAPSVERFSTPAAPSRDTRSKAPAARDASANAPSAQDDSVGAVRISDLNLPVKRVPFQIDARQSSPLPERDVLLPAIQLPRQATNVKTEIDGKTDVDRTTEFTADDEWLPSLEDELRLHGGAHLYAAEGDGFHEDTGQTHEHVQVLRLPEWWQKPLPPMTGYAEFEGADEIRDWAGSQWFGENGFQWEPRLVGYGSYELFGLVLEQGGTRQDGIGHQLIVDLDMRITGTERAHVQFRPFGRENSGGSFFQINDRSHYDDNSTGIPDRWWIEGEFYSLFGGLLGDEFTPYDYHITLGKVPFRLHNQLLVNDEMTGVMVTKNTLIIPPLSNLNIQGFYFFDDVNTATPRSTNLVGLHAQADWRHVFLEGTLAYVSHPSDSAFDSRYGALSVTRFFGPLTLAGRALFKGGDEGGRGDGALYVIESNFTRSLSHEWQCRTGIEYATFYATGFNATSGWNSISGANFNRLRTTFAVDPLVRLASGQSSSDTQGVALGVQLFRHHEDESFIPEVAYEEPQGDTVWGVGLRWQKKLGKRVYLDLLGVMTWSDNEALDREGVFVSTFWLF